MAEGASAGWGLKGKFFYTISLLLFRARPMAKNGVGSHCESGGEERVVPFSRRALGGPYTQRARSRTTSFFVLRSAATLNLTSLGCCAQCPPNSPLESLHKKNGGQLNPTYTAQARSRSVSQWARLHPGPHENKKQARLKLGRVEEAQDPGHGDLGHGQEEGSHLWSDGHIRRTHELTGEGQGGGGAPNTNLAAAPLNARPLPHTSPHALVLTQSCARTRVNTQVQTRTGTCKHTHTHKDTKTQTHVCARGLPAASSVSKPTRGGWGKKRQGPLLPAPSVRPRRLTRGMVIILSKSTRRSDPSWARPWMMEVRTTRLRL